MMKTLSGALALLLVLSAGVAAQQGEQSLSVVRNARFVYVTSYSGPEFSGNALPEDLNAITTVQNALQKWGYILTPRLREADMVVAVQSRESEDVLAVYDRRSWRKGAYLWRETAKGGLSGPNAPLLQHLHANLMRITGRTEH